MGTGDEGTRFVERHLDPADRLGEILFGLIMVLTFTLTAGIAVGEEAGAARELLVATIGCNIAWGLIDGGMFIMGAMLERAHRTKTLLAIQGARTEAEALDAIGRELDGTIVRLATGDERLRLYRGLRELALRVTPRPTGILRSDVMGAIASFWLVVATTIPAAIPFAVIQNAHSALRVSNAILIGLLFLVGFQWGRHANSSRWIAGGVFLLLGLALVGVAIALGG